MKAILALLLCGLTGCTTISPPMKALSFFTEEEPVDDVAEIMAIWQPGEGRDAQGLPSRGFAGQIFFFTHGNPTPVKITGDVKIYVFDDQGTPEEQRKPIHIYEFKEEAWNAYLTQSNIGHAYQVFIPYPREGGHRAVCSLRVKHTAKSGTMTLSDPADILLNGTSDSPLPKTTVWNETIVPESVQPQQRKPMQVTTIPTHKKLKRKLQNQLKTEPATREPISGKRSSGIVQTSAELPLQTEMESPETEQQLRDSRSSQPQENPGSATEERLGHHPLSERRLPTSKTSASVTETKSLFQKDHPFGEFRTSEKKPKTKLKVESILIQ